MMGKERKEKLENRGSSKLNVNFKMFKSLKNTGEIIFFLYLEKKLNLVWYYKSKKLKSFTKILLKVGKRSLS